MFGWLWGRDRAAGRGMFRYTDGRGKRRAVDPLAVWQRLDESGVEQLLEDVRADLPGAFDAGVREKARKKRDAAAVAVADLACRSFPGVGEYNPDTGNGLTVAERIRLVARFVLHMEGLAEEARPFTPSPSPTGPSPPASAGTSTPASSSSAGTPEPPG